MNIYCIYDNRAKSYGTPFFQPSDVHAVRAFRTEVNRQDPGNTIYLYPEEFDLMKIGEFDETTGRIKDPETSQGVEPPLKLANGTQLKTEVKS